MKDSLIRTFYIYLIYIVICILLYKLGKIGDYKILLVLGIVLIFIKDLILYFLDIKKTSKTILDIDKLNKYLKKGKIPLWEYLLIVNRSFLFPFLLISYMIYLLIGQSHFLGLDNNFLYEFINQNYLLGFTIFSGILTIFKENIDKDFLIKINSEEVFKKNIFLVVFLSLLGVYIIFNQVVKLGNLAYAISIISGILIFLVGISILEDDDTLES